MKDSYNEDDLQTFLNETSNQLDKFYKNKKYKSIFEYISSLVKNKPLDIQLICYEKFTISLVNDEGNDGELVRINIFLCIQDNLFNFSEISTTPDSLQLMFNDEQAGNNVSEIKYLVEKDIQDAGGHYYCFKKNREKILLKYPSGVHPSVKQHDKLLRLFTSSRDYEESLNNAETIDQIDKISEVYQETRSRLFSDEDIEIKNENDIPPVFKLFNDLLGKINEIEYEIQERNRIQSVIFSQGGIAKNTKDHEQSIFFEDNFLTTITWDKSKKEFNRQKKLLQKKEISFDPLSENGKPYFKRGDEAKAAASLFLYWHINGYITGLMKDSKGKKSFNIEIITNVFSKSAKREFNERSLRDALQRVSKKDKGKFNVFSILLNK